MKLSREAVEKLSQYVFKRLKDKDLVVFKAAEALVLERIRDVIIEDLRKEDDLDREVETILATHAGSVDSQRIDYRRMFSMIKQKLARERGIVL